MTSESESINYDEDHNALAWARAKVHNVIKQFKDFEKQCIERGYPDRAKAWKRAAWELERKLIGGEGCVIAGFDKRLPEAKKMLGE